MGVVIQAIRDSAKGERCTFCRNDDTSTVVFAHGPRFNSAGMGQKVDDWWGAYACHSCHAAMDEHRVMDADAECAYWLMAIGRTQRRLYEKGIMQFPEKPTRARVVDKVVPRPKNFRR